MPFSNLPFVVREHLKTLTDTYISRIQNKNINTLAILNGIYAAGQYGCFARDVVRSFPYGVYMAAMGAEGFRTAFPGVGQILKSKLISLEKLDLIETREVLQGGHISNRLFLTELGVEVIKASCTVYSGDVDQNPTKGDGLTRELSSHLIEPLMTMTTYIRGVESAGNIWYERAQLVDSVILGKSTLRITERMKAVIDIAESMIGVKMFYISEELKDALVRLKDYHKEIHA